MIGGTAQAQSGGIAGQVTDHEVRLNTLEGQNLGTRLSIIEGQNLDTRISTLEQAAAQSGRVIIVKPVGLSAIDNGNELLAGVQKAIDAIPAPSANDPMLILIDPGVYDVGTVPVQLPANIGLRGAGEGLTKILGAPLNNTIGIIAINSDSALSDLTLEISNHDGVGVNVVGQNVIIRRVSLLVDVPGPGSGRGITANPGTSVRIENVSISYIPFAVWVSNSSAILSKVSGQAAGEDVLAENGADVTIRESQLQRVTAHGASTNVNIINSQIHQTCLFNAATADIRGSQMANFSSCGGPGPIGTARVATSQVFIPTPVEIQALCVFSYNPSLVPLDGTCQ